MTVPCMGGDQEFGARGEPGCETEVSRRPALHRPTKAVPSVGCCENRATEGILAMESPQRPPRSAPPRGGMVPRETERPRQKAGRRGCGPSWFLYSRPLCPWIQPTAGGQHPGEKPCDCTSVRDSSSCYHCRGCTKEYHRQLCPQHLHLALGILSHPDAV